MNEYGGGKIESTAIFKVFSIISGITSIKTGELNYRQGFVFI